jgi:hypothetical protein
MVADKAYAPTAMQNRGRFTETFCCDRLELVFGKERVHTNVDIFESKARKVGEIDVLVLFGDRAVIVQAKSMRLTLESRKGNDSRIRDDFEKSVQDSYEQGLTCAKRITDPEVKLVGSDGQKIPVPDRVSEIYILCVVADHYPSLQFQSRQFLKYTQTDVIQSPMVLDVFALDAITEMLPSPLLFLSYINRRVGYTERLMATHETVILSHHLKKNLWIEESVDMLMLDDDISVDLDVAMAVRRDGVNGQGTPDGILTRLNSTTVGRIITALESRPEPGVIDFGFLLLAMSGKATTDASRASIGLPNWRAEIGGRTTYPSASTRPRVGSPCIAASMGFRWRRLNYGVTASFVSIQKAKTWFGVCLHPSDQSLRFGFKLDHEWQRDNHLERLARDAAPPANLSQAIEASTKQSKVGRNDPCPCGSKPKYKRCHGR